MVFATDMDCGGTDADGASSNYRELRNLVESIEEGVADGSFEGAEIFLFTDNSVAEAAYYKGNTPSRPLFDLVLRLRKIEISGTVKLWVVHVAGKRMIAQGTDGLSRGNLTEGVMAGDGMLQYVPLAKSALECNKEEILSWLSGWLPSEELEVLEPEGWFTKGHEITGGLRNQDGIWIPESRNHGIFLWTPAPTAAGVAVEELGLSRHKRTTLCHLFV